VILITNCDHCGSDHIHVSDWGNSIRIRYNDCGYLDVLWKDNEYDDIKPAKGQEE
jgi:hypothetical protein